MFLPEEMKEMAKMLSSLDVEGLERAPIGRRSHPLRMAFVALRYTSLSRIETETLFPC
jgi:hypothetical protein